ncbi:hypothetical protein OA85_06765 [Flavobacterium sp. AED]|nr:hypothetical protein OA85_06765 [Flavobacterium sp. AED]
MFLIGLNQKHIILGIVLIVLGIFFIWFGNWGTKEYRMEKYNPFKKIKRENTNDYFRDWLKIALYIRGIGLIVMGVLGVLGGVLVILLEFFEPAKRSY